jgi:NADH:ubiquinone oxidoreductase subunit 2 (subunit N)
MGFIAKFLVFAALIINLNTLNLVLVLAGAVNVVIAVYYYFDIIRRMYLLPPETAELGKPYTPFFFLRFAVLVPMKFLLLLGFMFVGVPYQYVSGAYFLTYYVAMA